MAAEETITRREATRKRAAARAIRAERAATATAAWQASGRAPAMKGTKGGAHGDDVLTPGEVRDLLNACGTSTTGIRNAAMLALLYGTAMRISEACGLLPADLDLGATDADSGALAGSVFIRARKGGKHDHVGIASGALPYLIKWTERRASLGLTGRDPYFCAISGDSRGNVTSTSYWRHWLPRLAVKAGVAKRVHAHGLRRSAATHMRDADTPLDVIQRQLGHASLATSQVYLARRVDAEHRRFMSGHGAAVMATRTQPIADAHAGAVVSMADATVMAGVALASLPADVRAGMTSDQVQRFMAGTVSAWTDAG